MNTQKTIARLNAAEIQNLTKGQLRIACRARGIKYGALKDCAAMRDAVLEWEHNRILQFAGPDALIRGVDAPVQVETHGSALQATPAELLDAQVQGSLEASPPRTTKSKPAVKVRPERVSVMAVLRGMQVGVPVSIETIVARTGVKPASLMTTALSCSSTAPSNKRFYETGMRFTRDADFLVRTA